MKFLKDIFNPFRILKITILILLIFIFSVFVYLMSGNIEPDSDIDFGVTFSQVSAKEMEIDWQKAYSFMLNDLDVKKLRLIAYWSIIEPNRDVYLFSDLDWQIQEAKNKGAEVILAVGSKLPGSLDCYVPEWARDLNKEERQERALLFLDKIVNHYNTETAIKAWQVEDKPFQRISEECMEFDKEFLNKEISLIRGNDLSRRPVILTASGEFSSWTRPAMMADKLGISIYRNNWTSYLGYFRYPIRPVFYKKRAGLVNLLTGMDNIVVIELQTEPKGPKPVNQMSFVEWDRSMSLDKFKDTIDYISRTGFDEVYLKGVEWWYYMKGQGNNSFWDEAKKLWSK